MIKLSWSATQAAWDMGMSLNHMCTHMITPKYTEIATERKTTQTYHTFLAQYGLYMECVESGYT